MLVVFIKSPITTLDLSHGEITMRKHIQYDKKYDFVIDAIFPNSDKDERCKLKDFFENENKKPVNKRCSSALLVCDCSVCRQSQRSL